MENNLTPSRKIGVVTVPFITTKFHFTFAVRTILSLFGVQHRHELFAIAVVNGCSTGMEDLNWFKSSLDVCELNDRNILARAWNKGIKIAFEAGCDYVLLINLDLIFHSKFFDNIVAFAEANPEMLQWSGADWTDEQTLEAAPLEGVVPGEVHYSCFMINKQLIEKVGWFDEQFEPAYHEDSDMRYRIRLAGGKVATTNSARFSHLDRVTLKGAVIESTPENELFLQQTRVQMDRSMELYAAKWGGLPGHERFTVPYDGKNPTS